MDKVVLKFRDEDREFDLEKPEDLGKIKELAEKGWAYEGGQTQLKEVSNERDTYKEKLDGWNAVLSQAQGGNNKQLIDFLERAGIKLSAEEKKDPDFLEDAASEKIKSLESQLLETTNQIKTLETTVFSQYLDSAHGRLEAKYNSGGWPAYDREAVEKHSIKHGISDLDTAYRDLNYEKILEMKTTEMEKHQKKIDKVKSPEPGAGGVPPKPPKVYDKKAGGYEAANADWYKEAQEQGHSVFTDEK